MLINLYGGNSRYGVYYLQSVFSILAFSRLRPGFWRADERAKWVADWLSLARNGMFFLAIAGLFLGAISYMIRGRTGIPFFYLEAPISLLLLSLLAIMSFVIKRNPRFLPASSAILGGFLLIGLLAWIAPWLNYGVGRQQRDITLAPGEVQGLKRLRDLAAHGERFATNKHGVNGMLSLTERSYAYGPLSESPPLLEGYMDAGEESLPGFADLLRDNDLLFTTTNAATLRDIARARKVKWLVARPGTDIALSGQLPDWLVAEKHCGDLKIYQIN